MSEKVICLICEGAGSLPAGAIIRTLCTNCLGTGLVHGEGVSHWDAAIRSLESAILETPVDHLSQDHWHDAEKALIALREISLFIKR